MSITTNLQTYFVSQTFDTRRLFAEFTKDILDNIFWQNKLGLIHDSDLIEFTNPKWESYPLQFCEDHYGNQYLYPVILLVNDVGSIFDFKLEKLKYNKIIAPKYNNILEVLSNSHN